MFLLLQVPAESSTGVRGGEDRSSFVRLLLVELVTGCS